MIDLGIKDTLKRILDQTEQVADKDRRRIQLAFPVALNKLSDIAETSPGDLPEYTHELIGVLRFAANSMVDQEKSPFRDATHDSREVDRIFAKRWDLDANYQDLLGVSSATSTTYPQHFKDDYL